MKLEGQKKVQPEKSSNEEKPKGFRRVAIAESDSDEENHNTSNEKQPVVSGDSSKPVIEEVSSSENTDWWQKKDSNYGAYEKPIKQSAEDLQK
jgi:hypothetical protein